MVKPSKLACGEITSEATDKWLISLFHFAIYAVTYHNTVNYVEIIFRT